MTKEAMEHTLVPRHEKMSESEKKELLQKYNVTVVGICRQGERITLPKSDEKLQPNDRLVVVGIGEQIKGLEQQV